MHHRRKKNHQRNGPALVYVRFYCSTASSLANSEMPSVGCPCGIGSLRDVASLHLKMRDSTMAVLVVYMSTTQRSLIRVVYSQGPIIKGYKLTYRIYTKLCPSAGNDPDMWPWEAFAAGCFIEL